MLIASLFTVARRWKGPNRWMDKQTQHVDAMKFYSATRRKEVLMGAAGLVDPGNIVLSEASLCQKIRYCAVTLWGSTWTSHSTDRR